MTDWTFIKAEWRRYSTQVCVCVLTEAIVCQAECVEAGRRPHCSHQLLEALLLVAPLLQQAAVFQLQLWNGKRNLFTVIISSSSQRLSGLQATWLSFNVSFLMCFELREASTLAAANLFEPFGS